MTKKIHCNPLYFNVIKRSYLSFEKDDYERLLIRNWKAYYPMLL